MNESTEHTAASLTEAAATKAAVDLVGAGRWQSALGRVATVAGFVAGLGYLLLMALTLGDVGLRGLTGRGIVASLDIVELALPALILLAFATTELSGTNIRTPIVTSRLGNMPANLSRAVAQTLATGFVAWMTYALLLKCIESVASQESRFALITVPVWPGRVVMVIGGFLFLLVLITEATRSWQRFIRNEPALEQEMESMP